MTTVSNVARRHDITDRTFRDDVIRGLGQPNKELNCKYFYDEQGSRLFEQICELDEYYLTRTELSIMRGHAPEMADQLGREIALVEFGSGSSVKTRILLDHLCEPVAYLPLDISEEHLLKTTLRLRSVYPEVEIIPIIADFNKGFELPATKRPYSHAAVYFPGSTIGNFTPSQASRMMRRIGNILGLDGGLLIGIDLQKDAAVVEAAYNDAAGVTEEFNLNVLHRINRDLDADIDVDQFRHKAVYNQDRGRVEISVVCQQDETIQIDDREFVVRKGEEILTEYSHKYSIDEFAELAAEAGFSLHKYWTDDADYFAVLHLVLEDSDPQSAVMIHDSQALLAEYQRIRRFSDQISAPLSAEDCTVQSMPDVSPTRWHLAHTTWFFETFVLAGLDHYTVFDPQFNYLFNSYYNRIGKQFPRPRRGLVSRPGLERIRQYRAFVDGHMADMLTASDLNEQTALTIQIGLNHEQQHQELMLTDIKHVLSCNPTNPVFGDNNFYDCDATAMPAWMVVPEGLYEVGYAGKGFAFDNELPRHKVFLPEFSLATSPVSCGQYLAFIEDGGYQRPDHWLSLGWATVCEQGWDAPLYWVKKDARWMQYTLDGLHEVEATWPVCHLSYFEADAFARWAGMRLPTEFEWEVALTNANRNAADVELQFADVLFSRDLVIHPTAAVAAAETTARMLGCVWEWTSSSYAAYPGYRPPDGALGEYNGKFMCNQYVLRGGSCASSSDHIRPTYRNFFPPEARWQFSGLRLVHGPD